MTAAPSSPNEELQLFDEEAFNLVDEVGNVFDDLLEKVKCSLHAVESVIQGSALKPKYEEFKAAVKTVLHKDVEKCAETEGALEIFKYVNQ